MIDNCPTTIFQPLDCRSNRQELCYVPSSTTVSTTRSNATPHAIPKDPAKEEVLNPNLLSPALSSVAVPSGPRRARRPRAHRHPHATGGGPGIPDLSHCGRFRGAPVREWCPTVGFRRHLVRCRAGDPRRWRDDRPARVERPPRNRSDERHPGRSGGDGLGPAGTVYRESTLDGLRYRDRTACPGARTRNRGRALLPPPRWRKGSRHRAGRRGSGLGPGELILAQAEAARSAARSLRSGHDSTRSIRVSSGVVQDGVVQQGRYDRGGTTGVVQRGISRSEPSLPRCSSWPRPGPPCEPFAAPKRRPRQLRATMPRESRHGARTAASACAPRTGGSRWSRSPG